MQCINSRFMIADGEPGRVENKTMPIIGGPFCLVHVGPILIGDRSSRKAVVNKQLHFDSRRWPRFIDHPTRDRDSISIVEHAAHVWIGRREEKRDGHECHQECFND